MINWKEYKLGELVAINERSIGRKFEYKFIEYIDTSSVTENKFDTPTYTTISEAPSRAKRLIADGDTIISTVRPIQKHYGFIKEAKVNQVVSTGFAVVTPKRIEPRFLYYFLTQAEITDFLNTIAEGGTTTFPAFKADELKDLPINLPNYETQTAIAEILSSLDDKIELNNKINQELENLAQTLFKHWFIDFEFPNENGEPYKSSGGEMVDSELGEIPKGWEVKPIGDLFDFVVGGDWGKDDVDDEHTEMNFVIRGTDIPTLKNGSKDSVPYRAIKPSKLKNRQLQVNDIIIEISGGSKGQPTGRTILISNEILERLEYNTIPASFCRLIRPKADFAEFLGIYLTKIYNEGKTWEYQNQSTGISNFQFKFFESSELLVLPSDMRIIDEFNSLISGFYNLMTTNENQELTNLRDTLLPKLISGELELTEV